MNDKTLLENTPIIKNDTKVVLSVVCAVFNGGGVIADMLNSYAKQKRKDTELIVIDGASTDNTLDIIKDSGVADVIISEKDKGIYYAWNKGISLCKGSHVSFIGSDDLLADGSLNNLVDACQTASLSINIIAGFVVQTRQRTPVKLLGEMFNKSQLIYRMPMAHVMSAHNLLWLHKMEGFDASYRSAGDYELLLRAGEVLKVQTIPYVLAYMEAGGISSSGLTQYLECWRARKKNGVGVLQASYLFVRSLVGIFLRSVGLR